ncbi:MAG: hydroxyisourate hydrolase [Spirochaetaceae bacterium]|nr:MAG: hydroxyisourate hydrolase [Spirochaetaceae bacterium]
MGKISTHVLDTVRGGPAEGVRVELLREEQGRLVPVREIRTNSDGRSEGPLLEGEELLAGNYLLRFHVSEYYADRGNPDAGLFLGTVPVAFRVSDPAEAYHVPLLVSPWAYSTYRGS